MKKLIIATLASCLILPLNAEAKSVHLDHQGRTFLDQGLDGVKAKPVKGGTEYTRSRETDKTSKDGGMRRQMKKDQKLTKNKDGSSTDTTVKKVTLSKYGKTKKGKKYVVEKRIITTKTTRKRGAKGGTTTVTTEGKTRILYGEPDEDNRPVIKGTDRKRTKRTTTTPDGVTTTEVETKKGMKVVLKTDKKGKVLEEDPDADEGISYDDEEEDFDQDVDDPEAQDEEEEDDYHNA